MHSLTTLDPLVCTASFFTQPAYQIGNAVGWLGVSGGKVASQAALSGRLYVSKSGWLLLSVPNAFVRGVFDALTAPGTELPTAGVMNVPNVPAELLNAHVSVMTADEVASVGADKINERGHVFGYTLGSLQELSPKNIDGVSKVWAIQVSSPALSALRKSYGLSPLPKEQPFHITVAVRRKGVLHDNGVSKGYETSAESDEGQRFSNPTSRGELKAAAEFSRSGKKDLLHGGSADNIPDLHGGSADNIPDREFLPAALAEGVKHEHEHTNDDQVAKEIAKDHLSEEPAYYEKIKEIEKAAQPQIIKDLLAAKAHSDNRRYAHKAQILKRLMEQAPQDWVIDDTAPKFPGITHTPTKFQFHTDRTTIPAGVKAAGSVYLDQLKNTFVSRQPLAYDHNKPVFENIRNHVARLKQQGDWIMRSRRNEQTYRAAIDPQYRHQLALQAFHGTMPQPSYMDQIIERYGTGILGAPK